MDSFVAGRDLSDDLCNFSNLHKGFLPGFLHSEELKDWWSKVQESSSFIIEKRLSWNDWKFIIKVLAQLDVSRIEHLVLEPPDLLSQELHARAVETITGPKDGPVLFDNWQLGSILSTGRFSALKTLRILSNASTSSLGTQDSYSLASALEKGQFRHLHTLSLPRCNARAIFRALSEGGISGLKSLSIRQNYNDFDWWRFLVGAIKSGKLPKMTSLHLGINPLSDVNLVDLVAGPKNWFSSLENLSLNGCGITSNQICSLVDAVMRLRGTTQKLALKTLDLHDNQLDRKAVDALVGLAESNRLPQLRQLDLGQNFRWPSVGSKSLLSLVETIQRGCLPRLQKLQWRRNEVDDESAAATVQAYFENQALTTEICIDWTQVSDLSLKTKLKTYRDRNVRRVALREKLNQNLGNFSPLTFENLNEDLGDYSPLTYAKVFLCGYQEVGKTRLRRTLLRYLGIGSKLVWETFPNIFNDSRTRGIEISKIQEKGSNGQNTTLVLWDLAGQEEYHVLHGTFFADLGFEGGKATTFVLVFKAPFETAVKDKLLYWLRFVASCSLPLVKRHVVIVLNCFNGKICTETDQRLWMALICDFAKMFNDVLHIRPHPFIMDVRKAASVKPLKGHLFDQARTLLRDVCVPRACFELQQRLKGWSEAENHNHLPILTWQAFEEAWKLKPEGNHFSAKALKIAASYLHEIGEIIYFEDKELTMPGSKYRSILVPDPEWFCRKVVGELLLPKEMLKRGSSIKASEDGSISLVLFHAFFEHLLVEGTQADDIISMLELVGLCYRRDKQKIIIPALIREDDYKSIAWESKGFTRAMGRCLATEDRGRNAIPMTLFRRLQVELAQDQNLGGRGDSEYRVGKSFLSFKFGKLFVLIQFDMDQCDPIDDRIDILVKSRTGGNPTDMRLAQVKCICEIMQKVEDLCVVTCPGLRYDIKVVEPSGAADRSDKMRERKLMSLREIRHLLVKGEEYLSWQLDGHPLELKSFLSEGELRGVVGLVEREYDECKRDTVTMGLLTEESLQEIECNEEKDSNNLLTADIHSKSISCERDDAEGLTRKSFHQGMEKLREKLEAVVRRDGHYTRQHIDKKSRELLSEFRHKREILVKHIQAQQSFFIEEKAASVPRYIFLSKKQGQSDVWISLGEAFKSAFELHMLCEAHFDDGFVHEVEGQEGIQLRKTKEWLVKISPWLRRSLQVAVVVGKTVGNVYLPGVFSLLPDFTSKLLQGEALAKAVDSAATMIVEEDEAVTQVRDGEGNYGTAAQPINLKERLIAQEVVKDLIREVGHVVFATKIGLRKVFLRATDQPHVGSSRQPQPSVLWICDGCSRKYGGRATDLSPKW